jgi:hypothetical protein
MAIYSQGYWEHGDPSTLFCDTLYTFYGHAYVGECVGCNFEWKLDTIDVEQTGPECTSADGAWLSTLYDRTLVQSDMLLNFREEAGYPYGYANAIGMRFGDMHYQFFASRPYFPTDVSREDGVMSWSKTSTDWDHHAGEDSTEVSWHHYAEPHAWPIGFQRSFELTIHYTTHESSVD